MFTAAMAQTATYSLSVNCLNLGGCPPRLVRDHEAVDVDVFLAGSEQPLKMFLEALPRRA